MVGNTRDKADFLKGYFEDNLPSDFKVRQVGIHSSGREYIVFIQRDNEHLGLTLSDLSEEKLDKAIKKFYDKLS